MKKMIILLFSFATFSLTHSQTATYKDLQKHREFMLVEMKPFTRDELIAEYAEIDLSKKGTAGIYAGNDTLYLQYTYSKNKISFQTNSKKTSSNAVLKEILKLLPSINRYKINGHFISLYHNKNHVIKAIAKDWD